MISLRQFEYYDKCNDERNCEILEEIKNIVVTCNQLDHENKQDIYYYRLNNVHMKSVNFNNNHIDDIGKLMVNYYGHVQNCHPIETITFQKCSYSINCRHFIYH